MNKLASFPPIVDSGSKVLILGTMPGSVSLARNQYYAYERNRFWMAMQELADVPASAPYAERVEGLLNAGVGLWDTLKHCERFGSLDANIRNAEPNDFVGLLERFPSISAVALNGQKAADVFRRRVLPQLAGDLVDRLTVLDLPSTSPANARGGFPALMKEWRRLSDWIGKVRA